MKLGLHLANFAWPDRTGPIPDVLATTAQIAEATDMAKITLMDHWFQMDAFSPAEDPMMEGYTTLGFLAAHTDRVQLGLLVTGVTYRHPGLLAKIVTTLDVLSDGRTQLGIGAAWYEREHKGLGVPFPPVAERFERLEETLQICCQMWDTANTGAYSGRHYQLEETLCSPPPVSTPRPSILVGGSGEKKTLRLVATYADACNLFATTPDEVAHKLDVLRQHCDAVGRSLDDIQVTTLAMGDPLADVDGFLEDARAYAALGVDLVEVMPTGDPRAFAERAGAELVEPLAELAT